MDNRIDNNFNKNLLWFEEKLDKSVVNKAPVNKEKFFFDVFDEIKSKVTAFVFPVSDSKLEELRILVVDYLKLVPFGSPSSFEFYKQLLLGMIHNYDNLFNFIKTLNRLQDDALSVFYNEKKQKNISKPKVNKELGGVFFDRDDEKIRVNNKKRIRKIKNRLNNI
ncbi:MAG: hypothetical protein H0W88_07865 [Parachlamydiaceae bacterium]|nr:hypothetical protein [Parachlamydiaceae bacterium]